jgi:acetyl-CoA acyltransferase
VIIDAVRTPIGRAHAERGYYRDLRSDDLATLCVEALIQRSGVDPRHIEDVVLGNTQQTGEQGLNAARSIGMMSGLPFEAGGTTVNRLCGSSLQALNQAAHAIMAGFEDVQIVGGFEHMQHYPMDHGLDINPHLFERTSKGALNMGVTAEFLAQTQDISRQDQDALAISLPRKPRPAAPSRKRSFPFTGATKQASEPFWKRTSVFAPIRAWKPSRRCLRCSCLRAAR